MPVSGDIEIKPYFAANWWSGAGVAKKAKLIANKGIPDLYNFRFFTLSIDPADYDSPLEGYLAGKDKMRRFLFNLRQYLGCAADCKWCWKLEFHVNGWPHWHLYFDHKKKLSTQQMADISDIWGLGRTHVRRCTENGIDYGFKYALKPVSKKRSISNDSSEDLLDYDPDRVSVALPDWFLDWQGFTTKKVSWVCAETGKQLSQIVEVPTTFSRVRFWQTSKGFYTGKAPSSEADQPMSCSMPLTMREAAALTKRKIQTIARTFNGHYKKSAVVTLTCAASLLFSQAGCGVLALASAPTHNHGYLVNADLVHKQIQPNYKHKLCLIQSVNQMSVKQELNLLLNS